MKTTTKDGQRRPCEDSARSAIYEFLGGSLGAVPDFTIFPDGDDLSAPGKCGWGFYVREGDTTSYVHEDLSIEWYGTSWQVGDPLDPTKHCYAPGDACWR